MLTGLRLFGLVPKILSRCQRHLIMFRHHLWKERAGLYPTDVGFRLQRKMTTLSRPHDLAAGYASLVLGEVLRRLTS
jgi:hypothetical protein